MLPFLELLLVGFALSFLNVFLTTFLLIVPLGCLPGVTLRKYARNSKHYKTVTGLMLFAGVGCALWADRMPGANPWPLFYAALCAVVAVTMYFLRHEKSDKHCATCGKELDHPKDETSMNCGGDCVECMADAGDPECVEHMNQIKKAHDEKSA